MRQPITIPTLTSAKRNRGASIRTALMTFLNRLILIVVCVITLLPAVWVIAASFSAGTSLYSGGLIPEKLSLRNYRQLFFTSEIDTWSSGDWFSFGFLVFLILALIIFLVVLYKKRERIRMRWTLYLAVLLAIVIFYFVGKAVLDQLGDTDFLLYIKNSLLICIPASALSLILATTMAYAFSRFKFAGRRFGLLTLILIQMFPAIMSIVAIFKLLQIITLLDTFWGLIIVYGGGGIAFNAWLLKGYIESIPRELDEIAYIDGATTLQAFMRIVLPLATPMMAVVFILNFIGYFQEFLLASIVLFDPGKWPIAVGMRFYIASNYSQNWTGFAAASIVASIPIMIIFFSLQRFLVEGLTKGALKG
jgi:arabinogalactan oligomer/maltooligosaccharide transport system permease protein